MEGRVYPVNREGSGGFDLGGNLPEVTLAKKQGQEVIQDGKSVKPRAGRGRRPPPCRACSSGPTPSSAPAELQDRARCPGEPGVMQTALLSGKMPCPLPPRAPSK